MKIHHTTSYLVYTGFKNLAQIVVISSMIHLGRTEIWINLLITHQELWTFQPQINAENSVSAINRSIVNTTILYNKFIWALCDLQLKGKLRLGHEPAYFIGSYSPTTTPPMQSKYLISDLNWVTNVYTNYFMVHITIYRYKLIENLSRLGLENRIPTLTIVIWQNEIKATLAKARNSLSC